VGQSNGVAPGCIQGHDLLPTKPAATTSAMKL
jgi:hypothetical protein